METRTISASRVFQKIRSANTRIIVNEGSSRSTKTFSILQHIIIRCLESKIKVTASRLKLTWAKATIIPDFKEVMTEHFQMWDDNSWSKAESTYYFPTGSEIVFVGLDEAQKFHGRKQDIAWVNEAIESDHKEFLQLLLRTTQQVILDYNPSVEQHWIYDKVIPRDDCTFIKSTYKDNPFLQQEVRTEIERLEPTPYNIEQGTADEVSWKIYGLGERAAHKGLIMAKVGICKELPSQSTWRKNAYGLDFGYTNDPTALIHMVYAEGKLYFDEVIYERGLTNIYNPMNQRQVSIEQRMNERNVPKSARIWADAAEPKSIQDLRNCGWGQLRAADKGPDSIKVGIDTILRYDCYITERSINLIKERNNYKWLEDSSGNSTNKPIDAFNHGWDGVRYCVYMEMRRGNYGVPIAGHGSGVIF